MFDTIRKWIRKWNTSFERFCGPHCRTACFIFFGVSVSFSMQMFFCQHKIKLTYQIQCVLYYWWTHIYFISKYLGNYSIYLEYCNTTFFFFSVTHYTVCKNKLVPKCSILVLLQFNNSVRLKLFYSSNIWKTASSFTFINYVQTKLSSALKWSFLNIESEEPERLFFFFLLLTHWEDLIKFLKTKLLSDMYDKKTKIC